MSTTDDKSIGARLLYFRDKSNLSQKQLADSIGVSLSAYQNYERGDRSVTKDVICALMEKYDLDPTWLLSGKERENIGQESDINIEVLMDVTHGFEVTYKAIIERNETAEWMNLYDSSPEEAEKKPRPEDEEIQLLCDEIKKTAKLVSLIGYIYNVVKDEKNEKERRKKILQQATIGLVLSEPSSDISKVFNSLLDHHQEEAKSNQTTQNTNSDVSKVKQNIKGSSHQIAGRDITNKGDK